MTIFSNSDVSMKNTELVSIIMPAYNCQDTLLRAVKSVIEQTYTNWELIIVNDDCPHNSYKVIEHIKMGNIKLLHNDKNMGVALTRNIGIDIALGKYIAFLDSDDYWMPEKLAIQVEALQKGADIVCSSYYREKNDRRTLVLVPQSFEYKDMLKRNLIGNLTGIYNSEKLGKVFQKSLGHEDYVMWLELCQNAEKIVGLTQRLAVYQVGESSISSNKFKVARWQWRIYREELGMSRCISLFYLFNYVYFGLKKWYL